MPFTRMVSDDVEMIGHVSGSPGGDGPVEYVASTGGPKRDGIDLNPARWLVDNFHAAGGPVLWGHDQKIPPIGQAQCRMDSRRRALVASVTFDRDDPLAVKIEKKVRKGLLRGISVQWDPCDRDGKSYGARGGTGRFGRPFIPSDAYYDLCEISIVPIPMDPQALLARSMRARALAGIAEDYLDPDVLVSQLLPDLGTAVLVEFERRGIDLPAAVQAFTRRGPIPSHDSDIAYDDEDWDHGSELDNAEDALSLRRMHAWASEHGEDDDPDTYDFAHHHADGRLNRRALDEAMANLAHTDIPDDELGGVYRHLAEHYRQFGEPAPHFRSAAGLYARGLTTPAPGVDAQAARDFLAAFELSGEKR